MKLHRLRLENVRGVTLSEVDFPAQGIVVLDGPNEIGKTSLLEALDLLLEEKDSSTKARVRAIQPVGADVGSVVEAEFSIGPHRLVYRKQFNRSTSTSVSVRGPAPEDLAGVAAHERVQAILGESLDPGLFKAVRLLQAAPLDQAHLSGSAALAAALDRAAGVAGDPDTADPLAGAAETEHARYFTTQGRPRGEYRRAAERLAEAEDAVGRAEAAGQALAADVERLADRVAARARLVEEAEGARQEQDEAEAAAAALEGARAQLDQAMVLSRAAAARLGQAERDLRSRREATADCRRREADVTRLTERLLAGEESLRSAREQADRGTDRLIELADAVAAAEVGSERARADVDHLRTRADLAAVQSTRAALAGCDAAISAAERAMATGVDDHRWTAVQQADLGLRRAEAQLLGAAAELRIEPAAGAQVRVDGRPLTTDLTLTVTTDVVVEVPGQLTARLRPGRQAAALSAEAAQARSALVRALAEAGVADLEQAARAHDDHRRAELVRTQAAAERDRILGGRGEGELMAAEERLAAAVADGERAHPDPSSLPADATAADAARRAADRDAAAARALLVTARSELDAVRRRLRDAELAHARADTELTGATAEVRTRRDRLAADRAARDDAALEAAVTALEQEVAAATVTERQLAGRLPPGAWEAARRRRDQATRASRQVAGRLGQVETDIAALAARIDLAGEQGRQEIEDEARSRWETARREYEELDRRARAARLLHKVLSRYRADAREAYVAPFRDQLRRLGRLVYGPGFDVVVTPDLRIAARTMGGLTVAHDQLSSGAREQLAVLVRLACAAVVDPADSVPLFFDDALGHSDPERLAALARAFSAAAASAQVIVLTSSPDRFAGIEGAHVIRLGPTPLTPARTRRAGAPRPVAVAPPSLFDPAPSDAQPSGADDDRRVGDVRLDDLLSDNAAFDAAVFEGPIPRRRGRRTAAPARPEQVRRA